MQPLLESLLMKTYDYSAQIESLSSIFRSAVDAAKQLLTSSRYFWTKDTQLFLDEKLSALTLSFSGLQQFDFDEDITRSSGMSAGFIDNMLAARWLYVRREWLMNAEIDYALQIPAFDVDAFYDLTKNSIVISSSIFYYPYFMVATDATTTVDMYGRILDVLAPAIAQAISPDGRRLSSDGSILDPLFWLESARAMDTARFAGHENCLRLVYSSFITKPIGTPKELQTLAVENMALYIAYNTMIYLQMNNSKEFFLSWAQTRCLALSNNLDRYKKSSLAKMQEYSINIPLSKLPIWNDLYACGKIEDQCSLFM